MTASRRLPLLALAWLASLGCATPPGARIEPLQGVAQVAPTVRGWQVAVPGGIGRVRVRLPAGAHAEIALVYADGHPFTRLEGVQVLGHPGQAHPAVVAVGGDRLRVTARDAPLDLTLIVIDYYR